MCSIWLLSLVTLILCNFYATLTLCMTLNCALHYINYVRSMFKAGQGNDLCFQVPDDVANFELVFPSR